MLQHEHKMNSVPFIFFKDKIGPFIDNEVTLFNLLTTFYKFVPDTET